MCRSAFHHFHEYDGIFDEMVRFCRRGGRISIQDIIAFPDRKIDEFFEKFEKLVDVSHHQTMNREFIENLYQRRKLKIRNRFEIEIELNFREYLGHATQTKENQERIVHLIENGIKDPDISKYFIDKEGILFFKRNVFLILGEKEGYYE